MVIGLDFVYAFLQLLAIVEFVEAFDGQRIEYELRQVKGHGQR